MRILISPSGNLYGSENVLFDYIINSELHFDYFFVPKVSLFQEKLTQRKVKSIGFKKAVYLYSHVFFILLKKQAIIYCNEAGHFRYLNLLARIFKKSSFIIHVRILEDCQRLNHYHVSSNMKLIVVSNFLAKKLNKPCEVIHDGYHFERQEVFQLNNPSKIKVGIVGRVTNSKGIHHLIELLKLDNPNVGFHLFGHMDSNLPQVIQNKLKSDSRIIFHDFKQNKIEIYQSVDLLLHLNEKEPLGRIFFEALDFGIPIIGFNHGGIGEIGNIVEYPYLVNSNDYNKLMDYIQYLDFSTELLLKARLKALEFFSIKKYVLKVDALLK